jgi:hypothetical protein
MWKAFTTHAEKSANCLADNKKLLPLPRVRNDTLSTTLLNNKNPEDFMFQLNNEEFNLIFQNGISSWGGTRKLPLRNLPQRS